MFGFKGHVPTGWEGILPRESEVFLLTSLTSPAEIFVLGRENADLATLKNRWAKGLELDNDIRLKAKDPEMKDGLILSEVIAVGSFIDKSSRAYAVARCSDAGRCITCLAVMPAQQFEEIKSVANAFLTSATFEQPSVVSLYSDFVWKEFLTNQMLTTYEYLENGSKESTVHLCSDGRFTAKISKKGILKNQNPQYKGTLNGTWSVEGIGEQGKLHLAFDKGLPELNVTLIIRDEKVYANEERYFVAASDRCK